MMHWLYHPFILYEIVRQFLFLTNREKKVKTFEPQNDGQTFENCWESLKFEYFGAKLTGIKGDFFVSIIASASKIGVASYKIRKGGRYVSDKSA
jgi:hypothetical protein